MAGTIGDDDTSSDAMRRHQYRARIDKCYQYLSSAHYVAATMLQPGRLPISTVTPVPNKMTHQVDTTH